MGSSRLPGKVLLDLNGVPVLEWIVRAARATVGVDEICVATSISTSDDAIVEWCVQKGVHVFRGSETDVLDRFAGAARALKADVVVRLTADCPLHDPSVIGQVIRLRAISNCDYASNVDPPTWPDGVDCEVFTSGALFVAANHAVRASDREHVTPFIRNNRGRFRAENLVAPLPGLSMHRWTLDTPGDYEFLSAVAKRLDRDRVPSFLQVLSILDDSSEIKCLNASEKRNAGFAKSLMAEPLDLQRSYGASLKALTRAESVIPLGTQTFSKSRLQLPPQAAPLFLTHGHGGRVYDIDGNEYVDLVNALLPNVLGYRDPDVDAAIRRQLNSGISFSLPTLLETELAERFRQYVPCAEMVRFGKNGTDATSAAVRLARAATGRDHLIMLGYHGWQDWFIGATSRNLGVPRAVSDLSHTAPFGDLEAVATLFESHKDRVAAVILEPAGAREPPEGYLRALKEMTHKNGALLIFDEMITGFRWSLGGAQSYYGVVPDLACFGKALGNGMPISAVVGCAEIMQKMNDIFFSATFGGETLSLAAAIATIDKIKSENVISQLWERGRSLMMAANREISRAGLSEHIEIIGAAPWAILNFKEHHSATRDEIKTLFLREMIAAGVLINASHNVCFAHSEADFDLVGRAYQHACFAVKSALEDRRVQQILGDNVIRPIFRIRAH